jgi:hypothetical protein
LVNRSFAIAISSGGRTVFRGKNENNKATTHTGKEANEFYPSILGVYPSAPDMEALEELTIHLQAYADEFNK